MSVIIIKPPEVLIHECLAVNNNIGVLIIFVDQLILIWLWRRVLLLTHLCMPDYTAISSRTLTNLGTRPNWWRQPSNEQLQTTAHFVDRAVHGKDQ